ncbi:MAG TPA: 4-(cytidine 5'-diphospho)-2-C-methyl-D-erythritol kinase [Pyrinomonadaceae bacterium]|nr:4-(cytidine 5'-diphospho)-2-C-methyl-D-erythritol kinase [Pyrinomonadaceae bacterium]
MISFTLPSFAKINWFLRVLGKRREDGFHEICTAFQTISLHDNLTFSKSETGEISLSCDQPHIPVDERNLIFRAGVALGEKFGVKTGARIHLEKRIPAPGGLGGGSSNAAIALLGLARLWQIDAGFERLCEIGAALGSDVPFFFFGGTALGTGRGTEISPVDERQPNEKFMLVVAPEIDVPTAAAFEGLNAARLTNHSPKSILKICRIEAEKLNLRQSVLINDFEPTIFKIQPEIRRVKEKLLRLGASRALMSGSGASVFAVFDKEETRQATLKALESEEKNWRKFAVATISRSEYREALEITE